MITKKLPWVTAFGCTLLIVPLALRRLQLLNQLSAELRRPRLLLPLSLTGPVTLALARKLFAGTGEIVPGVQVRRQSIKVPNSDPVDVLVYESSGRVAGSGALIWIHGGGTVAGRPEQSHDLCSLFARELGIPVVSVDYRLAPENPFPAALDDVYAVLRWLHENAPGLNIDAARIAVGGDSAGGGLAACLAQRAYDSQLPVCFQLLIYPMLDDRTAQRTDHLGRGTFAWTPASNRFAWRAYLGGRSAEGRPYSSAARREDLRGLPPAWLGVGDADLFYKEDLEYYHRLQAADVQSELHIEPGMYHGADAEFAKTVPAMKAFRAAAVDALRRALQAPVESKDRH